MININSFTKTKNVVYFINFHIVFCTRYRRNIFQVENVKEQFIAMVKSISKELDVTILEIQCENDHVYLQINCSPKFGAAVIIQKVKYATSKHLRSEFKEFEKMPNIWTRNYLISTNSIQKELIEQYVNTQKKRY